MKKFDFIIIGVILIFLALFGIFFINNYKTKNEDFNIDVLFQNELLYSFKLEDEGEYKIQCVNNLLTITKNDILVKEVNVESKDFNNTFKVKNKEVKMIDASCSGKDCTKMYITKKHVLPIVCTNGIVLNPNKKSDIDIIV